MGVVWERCCRCNCEFTIPEALREAARASSKISFWCPYGHEQHYKSKEDIGREEALLRERDRLKQQIAEKDDAIRAQNEFRLAAERQAAAARGQVTRLRNRVKAGMCPCCNRHFTNLERHMATKHADMKETA